MPAARRSPVRHLWQCGDAIDGQAGYRVGRPTRSKGCGTTRQSTTITTGPESRRGTANSFEGRLTANGEIFDLNQLTAAHTTLPMPSIVQVTNLENGRSLQLRVNDRGPFVDGRLIDVTRRAAQLLGFENKGTTRVRVTVLKDESIAAAEEAMHGAGQILVADAAANSNGAAAAVPVAAPLAPRAAPSLLRRAGHRRDRRRAWRRRARRRRKSPWRHSEVPPPREDPPATPIAAPARAAPSRFALIAPAEAAELPAARVSARKPGTIGGPISVPQKPPWPPRVAAAAGGTSGGFMSRPARSRGVTMPNGSARALPRLGSVQVTAASINGVEMYRVRLGPFENAQQADRLLARVVDRGYPAARIVND